MSHGEENWQLRHHAANMHFRKIIVNQDVLGAVMHCQ